MNNWQRWLDEVTDQASARSVADLLGRSHTTVSRWMYKGKAPNCPDVITIARTYGADPIEGMIAAGWLRESDITASRMRGALTRVPAAMLTEELHDRLISGRLELELTKSRRPAKRRPAPRPAPESRAEVGMA